jgi:Protein of unknown function (DUF1153)
MPMTLGSRPKYVVGLDGAPLALADLPASASTRWVIRRKAELVAAVRRGLLSLEDACSRYNLTVDEFLAWQHLIDRHGFAGLRATRIHQYRPGARTRSMWAGQPRPSGRSSADPVRSPSVVPEEYGPPDDGSPDPA